ncbi:MAG: methyltransferase domain-containing protein [Rhodospirillales bacterium]|nr:methyltransferase domain-containing protein [Rhodospirillales bacterium]
MREMGTLVTAGSAQQACTKGWDSYKNGRYDEAEGYFRKSISLSENPEAYYGLGVLYKLKGMTGDAIACLNKSISLNPYFSLSYGVLGDIYLGLGSGLQAIEQFAQGIAADPASDDYKHRLIQIMRSLTFKKINENLKGVLLLCMETPGIDLVDMGRCWLSIIESDEEFSEVYKLSRHKDYHSFRAVFDRMASYEAFLDPFFLTGLGQFIVADMGFERWATHLRRMLLETLGANNPLGDEAREYLACALSRYCFLSDYIFVESPEEQKQVSDLKKKLEKQSPEDMVLAELAILGCYMPLCRLKKARKIAEVLPGGDHVSQIPKGQIEDYFEMEKIRKKIPELTPIENETSQAVQVQYEEFPYPRWTALFKDIRDEGVEGGLTGTQAKILVAGCGTGREALELACVFPDADVLAVDLSKSSLSYGIMKAEQFGITNVTFKHGDILELGVLEDRFDYIASSGVLHHLKEPMAGWRVLTGLLKPEGLMRIALYSCLARKSINEARQQIAEKGIGNDAVSIREFRRDARKHLKFSSLKTLEEIPDYYSMPECRDLLFHVQEHQFDLEQLEACLHELGLEFLKFYIQQSILDKYVKSFPDDPKAVNLENWAKLEIRKPEIFIGMYRFWCRKPA